MYPRELEVSYFVYVRTKLSGETVRMRSLVIVFTTLRRDLTSIGL